MLRSGQNYIQIVERGSHAGQSVNSLAAVLGRVSDRTPRLSRQAGEFEQVIMELYRAEYMVGGT